MAIDLDAQDLALLARAEARFAERRGRLEAARRGAFARNPRLLPAASGSAGSYTLADGSTLSVSASLTAPGSATAYPTASSRTLGDYEALISIEGGRRAVAYASLAFAAAARTTPGSDWSNPAGKADGVVRYAIDTNAPALTFAIIAAGSAGGYRPRLLVDGQYVDRAGHALADTSSAVQHLTLGFGSARMRTVTLELQCRYALQRILIVQGTNHYAIGRPADRRPRLMVVADSFGLGPYMGAGVPSDQAQVMQGDNLYTQAADWLGAEGIVSAVGGTGFSQGGAGQRYDDRWQDVLDAHAQEPLDAIHIHGTVNDVYATADAAATQATATPICCARHALSPNCRSR